MCYVIFSYQSVLCDTAGLTLITGTVIELLLPALLRPATPDHSS